MERWQTIQYKPAPLFAPVYGPMTGLRVLLSASVVAAPHAATMLGDFGAEIIQVEMPKIGDAYRTQRPFLKEGDKEVSLAWLGNARNRLSFTLNTNMKIPESKEIFLSLIKNADVWIENIVWLDKLGINDAMLHEINPRLIIVHVSGFGRPQFGGVPEVADRGGYDPVCQAESGYSLLQGFPDRAPVWASQFFTDYMTGMFAFSGILMALHHREKTGKGQSIDVSLTESIMRSMDDCYSVWMNGGILKKRFGNKIPIFQPGEIFETKDGRYINIGAFGPSVYKRSIKAFGLNPDDYPYEKAGASPEALQSPLGKELTQKTHEFAANHTAQEMQEIMMKHNVPAGILKTVEENANDPHWIGRNSFITFEDQTLGREVKGFGVKPIMSDTPGKVWRGAPRLGQDTEDVLKRLLGYSDAEIEALKGKGVID